jgi:putative sugar O-methyltransferase
MAAELGARGLKDFRTNQTILKGFAVGGLLRPAMPRAIWKRVLWRGAERLPVTRQILAGYRQLLEADHKWAVTTNVRLARLLIDRIAMEFPDFRPTEGLANGGAEDVFEWRGHLVTADWLLHVVRAAAFYRRVPPAAVRRMIEIGPGLGLSSLAHLALNPSLETIVNVDIPPVLYVSTQFLKSVDGLTVVDMRDAEHDGRILLDGGSRARACVVQIAPWQLPRIQGTVDLFFNAYSFQEMERDVCGNYAKVLAPMVTGNVFLLSTYGGHAPGAGGQGEPITVDFLEDLFKDEFNNEIAVDDPQLAVFQDLREAVLLSRAGA